MRLLLLLVAVLLAVAPAAQAEVGVREIGPASAPRVEVFLSPSCPHCARFETETLPALVRAAEQGRLRLAIIDLPLSLPGFAASAALACVPEAQRPSVRAHLLARQDIWSRAADPIAAVRAEVQAVGIPEAQVRRCQDDQALRQTFRDRRAAAEARGISQVPAIASGQSVRVGLQGARESVALVR
jgi:protein-disulfide isomerase